MYFCHFKFYLQKHSWFISKISKIPSEFFFKLQQCDLHWSKERVLFPWTVPVCLPEIQSNQLNRFSTALAVPACLQSPPSFTAETRLKHNAWRAGKPQSSFTMALCSLESLQCSSAFPHFDSSGGEYPKCSRKHYGCSSSVTSVLRDSNQNSSNTKSDVQLMLPSPFLHLEFDINH